MLIYMSSPIETKIFQHHNYIYFSKLLLSTPGNFDLIIYTTYYLIFFYYRNIHYMSLWKCVFYAIIDFKILYIQLRQCILFYSNASIFVDVEYQQK